MIRLAIPLLFFGFAQKAVALDRVQMAQSKLHSSLAAILPSSDFLVIVNRSDTLDDGGASQAVDGSFKSLPGLGLGVDDKGQIVMENTGAGNYSGPISVSVIIENKVRDESFKTIEKLIPDIIGGLRDDDELKITRGPIRQPPVPNMASPQVSIQNVGAANDQTSENLKFFALILITGGIFFWFMSRLQAQPSQVGDRPSHQTDRAGEAPEKTVAVVAPEDFALLDPEAVALYLLKEAREQRGDTWSHWLKCTASTHHREVFRFLPAWTLSFFKSLGEKAKTSPEEVKPEVLSQLFNDIAMIEQSLKTGPQKKKAFLQWFPAQALRFVPRRYQTTLSDQSKLTLWSMRPDLGNFVRLEDVQVDQIMRDPNDKEIESCFKELFLFTSTMIDNGERGTDDVVARWVEMINQLNEFSPIDSQIEQARSKLSESDLKRLLVSVAHVRTPFDFSNEVRKDWLRTIDPNDYFWWIAAAKEKPTWNLKSDLRPMRLAMFQQAEREVAYTQWSEDQKKKSSERLLKGFRTMIASGGQDLDHAAA